MGCLDKVLRIFSMGCCKSTATTGVSLVSSMVGRNRDGSVSSFSRNIPCALIFARIWRSAEQDTPIPMGQDAPCLGRRITLTSWQKYLPPNCAPIPISRVIPRIICSHSKSRHPWPVKSPVVGRLSKSLVEAALTVLSVVSAEVPPMTTAK